MKPDLPHINIRTSKSEGHPILAFQESLWSFPFLSPSKHFKPLLQKPETQKIMILIKLLLLPAFAIFALTATVTVTANVKTSPFTAP